jgi:DNA-binding NarL/FixJ family response regulator
MNVLLIDDHFCAREGLACLLKQIFPELQVFEAESFEQGFAIVRSSTLLNLVLLDVQLPDKDGLTGLAELKKAFPELCVVMFSGLDDRALVFDALNLGAMGFIVKTVSRQVFIEALTDVLSGKVYLPASVVRAQPVSSTVNQYAAKLRTVSDPASLGLTPREFEVLNWLAQGQCNKQIARQLGIEEQTVRNHLRPIFQKFGVARRTELLVKLYEQGIVFGKPGVGNRESEKAC